MKECVLSIDIGGTKVAGGIISPELTGDAMILHKHTVEFKRGKEALQQSIKELLGTVKAWGDEQELTLSSTICVGTAGNISPDLPVVLSGSAVNLGLYPEEFDNVNMEDLLKDAVNQDYSFRVCNDGCCQLAGGVRYVKESLDFNAILNKKVAYIGPGTGLGGAFATVTENGLDYYTDGHIYDMEIINYKQQPIFAEGVFSGTGFKNMHHISTKEINENVDLFNKYSQEIDYLGDYLYQICKNIYLGDFKKVSKHQWKQSDYDQVKGTSIFFMGGSIGTRGKMADRLISVAQEKLYQEFQTPFTFYKIPDPEKAAIAGAALFFNMV